MKKKNFLEKNKTFSDLFEAILGAIFLDGGFLEAKKFLMSNFKDKIEKLLEKPLPNYKEELQNYCQQFSQKSPKGCDRCDLQAL